MCGLAGIFLPRGQAPRAVDLDAMLAVIGHRGPDGSGRFISPDRTYQAGFVRLAIIDLSTGDQPLVEPDPAGRVLLGNGEIYNYQELRRSYGTYPYRTNGDMEPVLAAMDHLGEAFPLALNGMFALALYQRDRHRLTLVRDRLGIKPLYWARLDGGGVIFASEIKALFASGLIDRAVDDDAVTQYLVHGYVPAPATLYRGVNKLPPGHRLVVEADGGIRVEQWWRAKAAADLPADGEGVRRHMLALLDDSVRLQLRSDVPVGALLSGGIDSGLIVALAAQALNRPLNTYTVSFEGAAVDEAPLAALVAQRYGTRHTRFTLPAADAADYLPRLAWYADEPLADAALLPNYLISQVLGQDMRVVLNGTGGDELFAGYGRYFPLPVEQRYLRLPRPLRQIIQTAIGTANPMLAWQLARAEKRQRDRGAYLNDHTTQFPPPMLALLGHRGNVAQTAQSRLFKEFSGPADNGQLYADMGSYLSEDLLTLLDRTTMAVSVEGRVPFLDHRLVEAALAVPPDIRTTAGRQKALERDMARDLLPPEILAARKQGFASPVPAWFRGPMRSAARRLLTRRESLERGWWSRDGIERMLADTDRHAFRLYQLVMLELAVRLHVEQPHTAAPDLSLAELAG